MPHLSLFDRVKIVYLFNKISNGVRDKYSFVSYQAKTIYQISISDKRSSIKKSVFNCKKVKMPIKLDCII